MSAPEELPTARVEAERRPSWALVLPLLALALALWLVREAWNERGPHILVHAEDGRGLRPGDELRHRGIEVGSVESIELEEPGEGASGVRLGVRLQRSAADLARSGARFWIVRPELGIEGARGLETLLGSRWLAVQPGPREAPLASEFVALEEPPLLELEEEGSVEIVLESEARAGLGRGAPLLYRGIPVGTIVSVGLASDATLVEIRARIRAGYAELVRADTRFWRQKGAELTLGLSGLTVGLESLQSLWLGGVALATPTHPGARAATGQRFPLHAEPEEEWLAWRPALALTSQLLPAGAALPARLWSRLSWTAGGWLGRERSRSGWLVAGPEGIVGPRELLVAPDDAREGSVFLELEGARVPLAEPAGWTNAQLARRTLALDARGTFPGDGLRLLVAPEDLLVWGDPALAPVAVAAAALAADGAGWRVGERIAFDERWHGAAVVARADGKWVGVLLVTNGQGHVAPVPLE